MSADYLRDVDPSSVRSPRSSRVLARSIGLAAAVAASPVAVLAMPFWAVASLTRRLPRLLTLEPRQAANWRDLMRYVPDVGWQTRANLDTYAYADDLFHVTTDAEGWRGPQSLDSADVVVFGDSYAFGHGVDDLDMYTEHIPGRVVKALGSDGYSMVHAVLWMERLQRRIAGKHVFWMVYAGNDLYDNLRPNYDSYRMPYVRFRDGRWEIYNGHVSDQPWPVIGESPSYRRELARVCTPVPESDRTMDAAGFLIQSASRICSEVGSDLTILSVPRRAQIDPELLPGLRSLSPEPDRFDPRRPDEELAARAREARCRFVALADHLGANDYQVRDIHWRPSGHRKVAAEMSDLLDSADRELNLAGQ